MHRQELELQQTLCNPKIDHATLSLVEILHCPSPSPHENINPNSKVKNRHTRCHGDSYSIFLNFKFRSRKSSYHKLKMKKLVPHIQVDGSKPYNPYRIEQLWSHYTRVLGFLPPGRIHVISGKNLKIIQGFLGHESLQNTQSCVHH